MVCEMAFLITAGVHRSGRRARRRCAPTSAEVAVKSAVRSSVIGLGGSLCFFPPGLGFPENSQARLRSPETFALYDPMIPSAYYSSWRAVGRRTQPGIPERFGVLPQG